MLDEDFDMELDSDMRHAYSMGDFSPAKRLLMDVFRDDLMLQTGRDLFTLEDDHSSEDW